MIEHCFWFATWACQSGNDVNFVTQWINIVHCFIATGYDSSLRLSKCVKGQLKINLFLISLSGYRCQVFLTLTLIIYFIIISSSCYTSEKSYWICGLQLPREPHGSTRLLQLTGRWQYDGIMWLAWHSIKSNNMDFLSQIPYFSVK